MLEHTRKRHINLTFKGPEQSRHLAVKLLKAIDFDLVETTGIDVFPADAVLAEFSGNVPGACLRSAREKQGITQKQLSELTEIPQRHISEMENNKRPIGKKNAKILAQALNVGYKIFL
jgi:hypothetical protein